MTARPGVPIRHARGVPMPQDRRRVSRAFAVYRRGMVARNGQDEPREWVLLTDGAWANPERAHATPQPPHYLTVRLFTSARAARAAVGARADVSVEPWPRERD